jgi:osomolarity two-component system phosphorelay intermediate protein YPD1
LGLTKVKDSCEMIQHWGSHKDNDGATDLPDDEVCLTRIKDRLVQVKKEYGDVNKILTKFFDEQS